MFSAIARGFKRFFFDDSSHSETYRLAANDSARALAHLILSNYPRSIALVLVKSKAVLISIKAILPTINCRSVKRTLSILPRL